MHTPIQFKKALAATIVAIALSPAAQASDKSSNLSPNPDRLVPNPGMLLTDLRFFYGEPSIKHNDLGTSETEVWDYGTFRVFVADGIVQRSKLW